MDIDGRRQWLNQLNTVEYEDQSHIIKATTNVGGADIEVRYFGPFGLEANATIMAIRVKNPTANEMEVTTFAKPNMKLGRWTDSRRRPGDIGEKLSWTGQYGIETGPAGGHAIYYPISGADLIWCGRDFDVFTAVENGDSVGANFGCAANEASAAAANDQTMVTAKSATIPAGGEFWWGQAILFVNDNPSDRKRLTFGMSDQGLMSWRSGRPLPVIKTHKLWLKRRAEFEAWRVTPESLDSTR